MNARVAVTGMAGASPIGNDETSLVQSLVESRTGIVSMPDWARYRGLNTRLGGQINALDIPAHFTRKRTRTMGRVALMAALASEQAVAQAGLVDDPALTDGRTGVAYGSSTGSPNAVMDFSRMLIDETLDGINATTYIRMMSHTTAVNVAVHLGLQGRVIPTSSACTSGSQGIGYAFEAVRSGQQTIMLAGGAEELSATEAAVFDTLFATSVRNDEPDRTPRPFDADRDGLVIGEGAATLVLENMDHARARGAPILAELIGFATNCDGAHVTQPDHETMSVVMHWALADAGVDAAAIDYVNGHGTATERGDVAESHATFHVFGDRPAFSSLKGHTGHTLGACGALEAWASLIMMRRGWVAPTLNLDNPDPACAALDYVMTNGRSAAIEHVMSTNFAFGGINTALIFKLAG